VPPALRTDTVGPRVTGAARGPRGEALRGAQLAVMAESVPAGPPGAAASVGLHSDTAGQFAVTLAPGVYRLHARHVGSVRQERRLVVLPDAPARRLEVVLGSLAALEGERRRLADSAAAARLAARRRGASACLANGEHAAFLLAVLRGWLADRGEPARRAMIARWGLTGVDPADTEVVADPAACQAAADVYGRAVEGQDPTPWSVSGRWLGGGVVVRVGPAYAVEVPGSRAGEWASFLLVARTRRGLAVRSWLTY
jgi:hypothetical protein